jgi:phospholipid-binding lipoprotein MlaA
MVLSSKTIINNLRFFSICFLLIFVPAVVLAENTTVDLKIKEPLREKVATSDEAIEEASKANELEIWDPLEPVNRGIFWFNDKMDLVLLGPISDSYDFLTPDFVQKGVRNFFRNLNYPIFLLSDLTQLKLDQVVKDSGRFIINSTIGALGLFDVAAEFGLEYHPEDFGTALGYYGVPSGPYLVLPLLGPSNLRDFTGTIVDSFVSPTAVIAYSGLSSSEKLWIVTTMNTLSVVNTRSDMGENIDSAKDASLDYYLFMQAAYEQYRQGVITDKSFEMFSGDEDEAMENESFSEE